MLKRKIVNSQLTVLLLRVAEQLQEDFLNETSAWSVRKITKSSRWELEVGTAPVKIWFGTSHSAGICLAQSTLPSPILLTVCTQTADCRYGLQHTGPCTCGSRMWAPGVLSHLRVVGSSTGICIARAPTSSREQQRWVHVHVCAHYNFWGFRYRTVFRHLCVFINIPSVSNIAIYLFWYWYWPWVYNYTAISDLYINDYILYNDIMIVS